MPRLRAFKPDSMRGQLAVLVAALVIPLFALQVWTGYREYSGARERAETDAMAFADATKLGVTQFLATSEDLLFSMTSHFGEGWLAAGDCEGDMIGLTDLFPFLVNALAVDADGAIVCSALPGPPGVSAVEWQWFPGIKTNPVFTLGEPVLSQFSAAWILPMGVPLFGPDGEVIGAVAGTVSLLELSRFFGGVTLPGDYLVTVATGDRLVVARSHDAEDWVGRPLPDNSGSDRPLGDGRSVATGPDFTGVNRRWGQIEMDHGWLVFVGVPDDSVYGPALAEAVRNALISLLIIVLGTLLAGRSYARIAGSMKELARGVRSTTKGEIVPLPPGTPTEVTAIVDQFNKTLESRDRAEAAKAAARGRFQSIFDNAVFGLYVSTPDGRFLQANPALASMLGYDSVDGLLEVGPAALYRDPEHRAGIVKSALVDGKVPTHDLEWLRRDSTSISVRVGGKMIPGPDGKIAFEMIVQDITEEKRTEEQLRQTQKMEAIGQLTGGIAHDFNNLLTVISGNVELLEDGLAEGDELRDDLRHISKATKRATSLTRRLLAFSRKSPLSVTAFDINSVIPDLEQMLVPLIGAQITLSTNLAPEELRISIDPGEFEQIVINLMLNARDAMPQGGSVTIETRPSPGPRRTGGSDIPRDDMGGGALIRVSDTGVGMNDITRSKVFEPFFTTKPMGEGTGLGLSTVYAIVNRADGTVEVESEVGEGTVVTIWLPETAEGEARAGSTDTPRSERGEEKVLVVEDDDLVRSFVQRALHTAGYEVTTAVDGEHALELIQSAASPFDLVLTDVVMPRLGGLELAQRLELIRPELPVLFMSGYFDDLLDVSQVEDRPDLLLRKPFSPTDLRARVRLVLDGKVVSLHAD
jgi:PAS domain S-box-containing protein